MLTLLARSGVFLLKLSVCGSLNLSFGDLFGLSKVSVVIEGLDLFLVWFGAVRPLHVFLVEGGSFGAAFVEVCWCFGLVSEPRLGVRFLTGEWGIRLGGRLRKVFVGDSEVSLLRLRLGESLLSWLTARSGLLVLPSPMLFFPP